MGFKDTGIRKSEFVAKTSFLCFFEHNHFHPHACQSTMQFNTGKANLKANYKLILNFKFLLSYIWLYCSCRCCCFLYMLVSIPLPAINVCICYTLRRMDRSSSSQSTRALHVLRYNSWSLDSIVRFCAKTLVLHSRFCARFCTSNQCFCTESLCFCTPNLFFVL